MLHINVVGGAPGEFYIDQGLDYSLVGPFSPVTGNFVEDSFSYLYNNRYLRESTGTMGENSVSHHDVEGYGNVVLYSDGVEYLPHPELPRRLKLRLLDNSWHSSLDGFLFPGTHLTRDKYQDWPHGDGWSIDRYAYQVNSSTVLSAMYKLSFNTSRKEGSVSITFFEWEFSHQGTTSRVRSIPGRGGVVRRGLSLQETLSYLPASVCLALAPPRGSWSSWKNVRRVFPKVSIDGNIDGLRSSLSHSIKVLNEFNPEIEVASLGKLSQNAINSTLISSVNMIEFLSELRKPQSLLLNLKNWLSMKSNADRYLTVNYGILPTVSDVKEISESIRRARKLLDEGLRYCYSSSFGLASDGDFQRSLSRRLKIAYRPYDSSAMKLISQLDSWGTLPTFSRLWDLIPYSFVVDWFLDVGKFLDSVDTNLRYDRLSLAYSTSSEKDIKTCQRYLPVGALTAEVDLTMTTYNRRNSEKVPLPEFTWDVSGPSVKNYIDGAALITQRRSK